MSITRTLSRRPFVKGAVAVAAAAALGGGLLGAQGASASQEEPQTVSRAATAGGGDHGGLVQAAPTPGNDARPAPAPDAATR